MPLISGIKAATACNHNDYDWEIVYRCKGCGKVFATRAKLNKEKIEE
jgi:uncharacterized C2H2 Zn-finger protein